MKRIAIIHFVESDDDIAAVRKLIGKKPASSLSEIHVRDTESNEQASYTAETFAEAEKGAS